MTNKTPADTPTAAQLELRLSALESEQVAAKQALYDAQAAFGDAVIGNTLGEADEAAKSVRERQHDVERLRAASEALQRRLSVAREREANEAWLERWEAFEAALEARTAAFEKAEQLVGPFFKAVNNAIAASMKVDEIAPISPRERVLTPAGWALMPMPFEGMARMKDEELASVRNALRDITKKSREAAVAALRMRAFHKPGAQPTAVQES